MVLAIVGMAGSGKTTLADHLAAHGFPIVRFGEIIIDEVVGRGLEINAANERIVREDFRAREGMDACARLALPRITSALETSPLVVVDGLYSFSEYKTLKRELGEDLVLVQVFTPRALRYARIASRPVRALSPREAEDRDLMEIEHIEKGGPIAMADYILPNDGTDEAFIAKADALVASLTR